MREDAKTLRQKILVRILSSWQLLVAPFLPFLPFLTLCLGFSSCGKDSNPLALLTPRSDRLAFDAALSIAQAAYDNDALDEAVKHGEIAYGLNSGSEEAAILLGYIYLGKAGVGPFQIASKMLAKEGEDEGQDPADEVVVPSEVDTSPSAGEENNGSALDGIKGIVGLSNEELQLLGELDNVEPELPIIIPTCAAQARMEVEKLEFVNKAVFVSCPFVASEVRIPEDYRHACEQTPGTIQNPGGSHFLWAFAHLTEALAFYSVLTYSSTDNPSKSNLELRVAKIQDIDVTDSSQLGVMLARISSLEATISRVMPVGGVCSDKYPQTQLVALVNDMIAVSSAFARMVGVPESMTKSITEAMAKIQKIRSDSGEAASTADQNKAFKGDITKDIGTALGAKIDALTTEGQTFDAEQTASICGAYGSITGDQNDNASAPTICQ